MLRRPSLLAAVALLSLLSPAHAVQTTGRMIVKLRTAASGSIQVASLADRIDGKVVRHAAGSPYVLVSPRASSGRLSIQDLPGEIEFIEPEIVMAVDGEKRSAKSEARKAKSEAPPPSPFALRSSLPLRPSPFATSSTQAGAVPNDPLFYRQWGMQDTGFGIHLPTARVRARGDNVIVAVVDTGVRQDLSDLAGTRFVQGYNAISNSSNTRDDNGHGSHVTGTIAQTTDNSLGCAGIAPNASIMPVKVLDRQGSGTNFTISVGLVWAADHGAAVANLSLGGTASRTLQDAVATCLQKGMVIVAATGNNSRGSILYPAAYPGVIAVGATTQQGSRATYSNYGAGISLVAPGSNILQQTFDKASGRVGYYDFYGTSMATPHVAGVAALVKQVNPSLTPATLKDLLQRTCRDLGAPGYDPQFGAGLLDAAAAVAAAALAAPVPAPAPTPTPTPTPAPQPAPTPTPAPSSEVQQVLDLVNAERAKAGAQPLVLNDALGRAAQLHSEDQAAHGQMSHTGSDGSNPGQRISRQGYVFRTWGENVAYSYPDPVAVMSGWMASPGHRANILNPNFREIGIGVARNSQGAPYWTQDFAAR